MKKEHTETYQINRIRTQHGLLQSGNQNVSKKHIRKRYFKGNLFIFRPHHYVGTSWDGKEYNQYFYSLYETYYGNRYVHKEERAAGWIDPLNKMVDSVIVDDEPSFF